MIELITKDLKKIPKDRFEKYLRGKESYIHQVYNKNIITKKHMDKILKFIFKQQLKWDLY